ncbi:hypothetical protein DNTS_035503 [Danionella cerebrum]|uniref:SH2 domain-containing protein n=1 Tax=Danionella cerebrum TaxID=2873325 RepID=A0A553RG67_9TELE|nr:hypothetical protein DNTS_035503 [Danionella translucida]
MAVPLPCRSTDAAFSWFTDFQRNCILKNGIVPEWFHGKISRKAAEEMLISKPPGYFLIRVSESRVGYTLSYRADDRFRHFMIDILPDNQFIIVGENKHYGSLHDLVAFHCRNPIHPYSELLTVACEQGGKTNYVELLFPQKKDGNSPVECIDTRQKQTLHSSVSEPNPSARLYPTLEMDIGSLNAQTTDHSSKPVPKPRTIFSEHRTFSEDTPPQLPPRVCLSSHPLTTTEEKSHGLMHSGFDRPTPNTPSEGRSKQKNQQLLKPVALSLAEIKKRLKKKHSKDHTYEQIPGDLCVVDVTFTGFECGSIKPTQSMENDYQELPSIANAIPIDGRLPQEYLNPPPFAPGY